MLPLDGALYKKLIEGIPTNAGKFLEWVLSLQGLIVLLVKSTDFASGNASSNAGFGTSIDVSVVAVQKGWQHADNGTRSPLMRVSEQPVFAWITGARQEYFPAMVHLELITGPRCDPN